jgi:hypothetical protein
MTPPAYIQHQIEARLIEAENAYRSVSGVCEIFSMTRERYIEGYLAAMPPLQWTATDS